MSEIVYELVCDSCGSDYEITYIEGVGTYNEPEFCAFCGRDMDLSDVEEEYEDDKPEFVNELDFEE